MTQQNDTSTVNSFSLPSAGGVVSLLNDTKGNTNGSTQGETADLANIKSKERKPIMSSSSSTASLNIPPSISHRSQSTSSESSAPRSPFSAQPSGGESNGSSSFTSVVPSTESSRDESMESGKVSRASEEIENNQQPKTSQLRADRNDTYVPSSPSEDEENGEQTIISNGNLTGSKRRRDSNSKADEAVRAQKLPMSRMLNSTRLAKSPPPIRNNDSISRESNSASIKNRDEDDRPRQLQGGRMNEREVPMNMHRATTVTQGGYGGKNELDKNETNEFGPSHRRRVSTGDSTNSSIRTGGGGQVGRKGSSNSQIIGGKKRYPCSFAGCDKTFSTSGHAARHNRIHTGSKPYRCTFPGCNASFSRQDNSLQHYRTHVLHPKSRNGGTVNLDATQIDAVALESELSNLDPETVATVQMGRKALEEGTAIAVVQEFIDGTGRRAEAVQRMVGQPKTGRRGSITAQGSLPHQWDGDNRMSQGYDGDGYSHHRKWSLDSYDAMAYGRGGHGQSSSYRPGMHPNLHWSDQRPMQHPSLYPPQDGAFPMSHPSSHSNGSYPIHPHAYPSHNAMSSHPFPDHYHMHQSHPGYRSGHEIPHVSERGPVPHSSDRRPFQPCETVGFGDRVWREGDNVNMQAPSYVSQQGSYPPSQHHPSNGQRPSHELSNSPLSHDRRRYSELNHLDTMQNGHRRSASSTSALQSLQPQNMSNGHNRPPNEAFEAPSPSLSVHSFRSEGPYQSKQTRDDRANNALSLLSNAAAPLPPVRTDKATLVSPKAYEGSATSPKRFQPRKSMVNDMHLPLPKALSQVPFSSDRSTNGLTPTPLVKGENAMANGQGINAPSSESTRPFKSQAI